MFSSGCRSSWQWAGKKSCWHAGYWLQNLAEGLNPAWAVLISSALFALGHLLNPNVSWNAILGLVFAGIFLAYGYLRTRQLWLPIGLHIGWNFFEGTVFGFQVSGLTEMPQMIRQVVQGPELITGGLFGPEAGLVVLPAMALGVLLIFGFSRLFPANRYRSLYRKNKTTFSL